MWLKEFKVALIEKDTSKLTTLMESVPALSGAREIDEAFHLLKAATTLVEGLKSKTQVSMVQIKKNIDFMKSTEALSANTLDIKS